MTDTEDQQSEYRTDSQPSDVPLSRRQPLESLGATVGAFTDSSRHVDLKNGAAATARLPGIGTTSDLARVQGIETEVVSIEVPNLQHGERPSHDKGDRDFYGHGPSVDVQAYLTIQNTNELWSTVYISAEETESDWTTFSGYNSRRIWPRFYGDIETPTDVGIWEIVSIDSDSFTHASYTDTDHDDDVLSQPSGELVSSFECEGDSWGDDNPSVLVEYNPVSLTIRQPKGPYPKWANPASIRTYYPPHTKGDREFAGNGPSVDVWAYVTIRNKNELWGTLYMSAEETEWDWTTNQGNISQRIWSGEFYRVKEIVSIDSDPFSYGSYTDTDHDDDVLSQPSGELVSSFECEGDSSGDDYPSVTAHFNRIQLSARW